MQYNYTGAVRSPLVPWNSRLGTTSPSVAQVLFAAGEQGAWYDPSDMSTMFQDVAGTAPVTQVGQAVALIRDKSGRGNHASQSVAASRPIFQVDEFVRPYLNFDGVDDRLVATGTANLFKFLHDNTGATVWAGTKASGAAVYHALTSTTNSGSGISTGWQLTQDDRTSGLVVNIIGNGSGSLFVNQQSAVAPSSAARVYSVQNSAGIHSLSLNGAVLSGSAGEVGVASTADSSYSLTIGASGAGTLPFAGRFYSLIVRGVVSTPADLAFGETYVNSKTGAF